MIEFIMGFICGMAFCCIILLIWALAEFTKEEFEDDSDSDRY